MRSSEKIQIVIYSFLFVFLMVLAINDLLHYRNEQVFSTLLVALFMLINLMTTLCRIYTNHPFRFRMGPPPIIYPQDVVKNWLKLNVFGMPVLIILCNVFGILSTRTHHSLFIYTILILITLVYGYGVFKDYQRLKSMA